MSVHRSSFILHLFCLAVSLAVSRTFAALPDVKFLFPAGAQRGSEVEVRIGGTIPKGAIRVWTSDDDVHFAPTKKNDRFTVSVDADAPPGPRWIRFLNDDGSSTARPFFVGNLPEIAEKESNEVRSQATAIGEKPTVVNGALGKDGDVDVFRVSLKKGTTFVAAFDANAALGSPIDAVLQLLDAEGNVLSQSIDDRGLDPRLVYEVPQDGDYYVRMFGFTAVPATAVKYAGSEDAVYRLTLTAGPYVDAAFPPFAPHGSSSSVELRGWNLPSKIKPVVLEADDRLMPQRRRVPHEFAGAAAVIGTDVPVAVVDPLSRGASPHPLAAQSSVAAVIRKRGEKHEYLFAAPKGQFRLRVLARAIGSPLDPVMKVFKPDGSLLIRLDDIGRGDPDVNGQLNLPLPGDYRFVVEDLFGAAGERYAYVLELRPLGTEFGLSFAAAELSAEFGKPFDLVVNVDRPPTTQGDIEIRVEGLPEGMAAKPFTSFGKGAEAKTTSKKVTFPLTFKEKFSGPIRIIGTLKGDAPIERLATAPNTLVPDWRLDTAWLTAVPPGTVTKPPPAKKK